jgi:hypothetical protein
MIANIVDAAATHWRGVVTLMGRDVTYRVQGAADATVRCFIYGVKVQALFGAALQGDQVAVINADEFAAKVGPVPRKFDRLLTSTRSYAVEEWRGSPNYDQPVVFKLLLRGGTQ